MNANDIIKSAMATKGVTQKGLAQKAGIKNQSQISEMLSRNSVKADVFAKLLNGMGCDVIVRDRVSSKEWVLGKIDLDALLEDENPAEK